MQEIENKLSSAFKTGDFDDRLKTASSTILTQRIEFQSSSKPQSSMNDMLKDKYVNLAPSTTTLSPKKSTSCSSTGEEGECLPHPQEVLFPPEKLDYRWKHPEGGAGLTNCGNTCFLNATLQCLIHTTPLNNYLLSGHHFQQCKLYSRDKCILCNLQMLMKRSLTGAADSFAPKWFINNLQFIGRHFRNGRQEDAHEFLRLSLERMQKCALFGYNHLDKYSKETTVINQIFGGFLRSQVVCLKCKHRSNTYDPLLDISLDIKNVDSIERALQLFVAPDKLDMDNAYKCEKCKQKVTALKRFSIHKAPNVLTIQLKRFQFAQSSFFGGGGKISKHIKYPARLNIRDYMSKKNGPPEVYSLFATIQHEGYSCQSGHYVANVRCGQRWFHFNDSMKRRTSLQQCLNESSAYILFYIRENPQGTTNPSPTPSLNVSSEYKVKQVNGNGLVSPQHSKFIGPVKGPQIIKTPEKSSFKPATVHSTPSNEVGSPFKATPLATKREKVSISFGVKPANKFGAPANHASPLVQKLDSTPRLVMKIKDGKSITIETSPDGEKRILSDDDEVLAKRNEKRQKKMIKKSRLVPYGDNTSSDSDVSAKEAPMVHSGSHGVGRKDEVVLDPKLNTTTSVPGNTHLYETVTKKEKIDSSSHQHTDKGKEHKHGHTPLKRAMSDSLTCVTGHSPAKHAGGPDWLTTVDPVLSPSLGSSSSSNHSHSSSTDWSVTKNSSKMLSSSLSERQTAQWTVTPGRAELAVRRSFSEDSVKPNFDSVEKDHAGYAKPQTTNMKRQAMQEQLKSVELTKNPCFPSPVVTSDRVCLLNTPQVKDRAEDEYKALKKAKKHKKHKKHRHEDKDYGYSQMSDESEHSHKKKKKKKKKHKHREQDEQRDEQQASKRKHHKDRENDSSPKRARQDSDSSSQEFVWVEKKVTKPHSQPSSSVPATPSQSWDHHIRDGYKKSQSGANTPVKSGWDGVKASKVVSELEKISSYSFGSAVSTWEGSQCQLDCDRQKERQGGKKRTSDDEYEEELDRGRMKKVKKHQLEHNYHGNMFQEEQERRNREKIDYSSIKVGDNNPYLQLNGSSHHNSHHHHRQ